MIRYESGKRLDGKTLKASMQFARFVGEKLRVDYPYIYYHLQDKLSPITKPLFLGELTK
jgi:hypothetical protein